MFTKKKSICEVISIVLFNQPILNKNVTVAALIPWVSGLPPKMGKRKKRPKRRGHWGWGMGMEHVEMAGNFFQ